MLVANKTFNDLTEKEKLYYGLIDVGRRLILNREVSGMTETDLRTLVDAYFDEKIGPVSQLFEKARAFEVSVDSLTGQNARLSHLLDAEQGRYRQSSGPGSTK